MTVYNLSTIRASKLPYKCCNFVGRHGETRQPLILFLLSMVTWCCLLVSHCTNICFIFIRGLLPHSPESADKNIKKNNVNSNWTTTSCWMFTQLSVPVSFQASCRTSSRHQESPSRGYRAHFLSLLHVCFTVHLPITPTGTQREGL